MKMEDENQIDEKKENIELNYAEKIETFKLMIENNNEDIALKFLQKANWDEEKAVILFHSENLTNPQNYNTIISIIIFQKVILLKLRRVVLIFQNMNNVLLNIHKNQDFYLEF